jgi:hypothetical protein
MPYKLQQVPKGFYVVDDKGKRFSKKPLARKRAVAQLRALWASYHQREALQGKGFFGDAFRKVRTLASRAYQAFQQLPSIRQNYPPYTREALAHFGDGRIIGLTIARTPIMHVINEALQVLTNNQYKDAMKKANYDRMFHVALLVDVQLPNGVRKRLVVEKNAVINITDRFTQNEHTEIYPVGTPSPPMTLNQMLEGARKAMGDKTYFSYDAWVNNCQVYVQNLLKSAGVWTEDANAWLFQPTTELLKHLPIYTPLATKALTSLGAWMDRLLYGEGRGMLRGGMVIDGMLIMEPNDYELELDADEYPEEHWIFKYMRRGDEERILKERVRRFWMDQYGTEPTEDNVNTTYEALRRDFYDFLRLYPETEEGPPTPVSLASNVERDLIALYEDVDDDMEEDEMEEDEMEDDADLLNFTDEEEDDRMSGQGRMNGGMLSLLGQHLVQGHATVAEAKRIYRMMVQLREEINQAREQGLPFADMESELRHLAQKYQALRRELEMTVMRPMRQMVEDAEDREYVQRQGIAHRQERQQGRGKKPTKWIQEVVGEKGFHEGAFTAQAKRAKMTTMAFAKHVLANPSQYQKKTVQRARFFQNVSKQF